MPAFLSLDSLDAVQAFCLDAWQQAVAIWLSGGWAMIGIAAISLIMFGLGMHVQLKLRSKGFLSVKEETWRRWLEHPTERRGKIGRLLDFVNGRRSIREVAFAFQQLRTTEAAPFERDLKVMKICVGAAPLVGLLGTVTGMLATFDALSTGSGGDKTMEMVASGISEALITTETGLVIALPGLFFQYQLARKYARYKAFLAHLESVCTQTLYWRLRAERRAAAGEIRARRTTRVRPAAERPAHASDEPLPQAT